MDKPSSESSVKTYQTRSGPMLALVGDMYITPALDLYGEYCPEEARMLRQIVKRGMTVVEIGANMGSHSIDLACGCAPGKFYAFEPQPRLFQILCANLALNDISNALAYPDACGEAEDVASIPLIDYAKGGNFGGISLGSSEEKGIAVRVRALDDMHLPNCGLIKIDVEGFEARVIRGAVKTIRRCRPILYVENDRAERQQELIATIAAFDYSLYWHITPLYDANNFRGNAHNIFPGVVSISMLCLPAESNTVVHGLHPIDPDNWQCPVVIRR